MLLAEHANRLTDDEFTLFRNLISEEAGIVLRAERRGFLAAQVHGRLKALGLRSPYQYFRLLTHRPGRDGELHRLLELLTIHETSFFRNAAQFDLLRRRVLPEILERKAREGETALRIWSAGCSTGQEPYSVAMEVLALDPAARGIAARIYASDISLAALEVARRGVYPQGKVQGVPAHHLARHFERAGGDYRVRDAVRCLVVFDYHNLKHDNGLTGLDVIFCRNVMIYFDAPDQRRLAEKLARALRPGGYLFLGHAESLHGLSRAFRFLCVNNGVAYRKDA